MQIEKGKKIFNSSHSNNQNKLNAYKQLIEKERE